MTGKYERPKGYVTFFVAFRPFDATQLEGLNRSERYQSILDYNKKMRDTLLAWLDENGLRDRVSRVSEANAFDQLFLDGPPTLRGQMESLPFVADVSIIDQDIELIRDRPYYQEYNV